MQRDPEQLFERFRTRGDAAALERVFDATAPELLSVAMHLTGQAARAEDLVQTTFVSAIEHSASWDGGQRLMPWLIGILARAAARARREGARSPDPGRLGERESVDPADAAAATEIQSKLGAALRALPSPYREVLEPHLLEEARAVDIARRLERAPGTVRMQILRGLELLRQALPPSLATAALLASGTRGHAAVRAAVVRQAAAAGALGGTARLASSAFPLKTALAGITAAALLVVAALWLDPRPGPGALSEPEPALASRQLDPRDPPPSPPSDDASGRTPVMAPVAAQQDRSESAIVASELAGRVVDAAGTPLPGVRVSLRRHERFDGFDFGLDAAGELVDETTSAQDGGFRFVLERGLPVDLRAEHPGYCESILTDRYAGQFVEVALTSGHRVHGRITRERDGAPIADARVRAFGLSKPRALERLTVSDADGRYELRIPYQEDVRLEVLPQVEQGSGWIPLALGPDGDCERDLVLPDGILIEGTVTDAATGQPIAGATIGEGWMFSRTVTSDEQGRYRFPGFGQPGVGELFARAGGFGCREGHVGPALDGRLQVDFALDRARIVRGRVVDSSAQPLAGAYVAAVASEYGPEGQRSDFLSGLADADGHFVLGQLSPDSGHALCVSKPGFGMAVYDLPRAEASQAEIDLGTIVLGGSALLAGRVEDGAAGGLAGAVVTLEGWNSDRFRFVDGDASAPKGGHYVTRRIALSDEQGRFWFGGVSPGHYQLLARKSGQPESASLSLLVQEGDEREDLRLSFGTGESIRGRVVDALGNGLREVHVSAHRLVSGELALEYGYVPSMRTADDGSFELRGLATGEYQLEASPWLLAEDAEAPWVQMTLPPVAAGGEALEITLERGQWIEGRALDSLDVPLVGSTVLFWDPGQQSGEYIDVDVEGRFKKAVPRGSLWTLELWSGEKLLVCPGVAAGTRDLVLRADG